MFSKSNIVSTLVATIWGFGGGYLLWGLLADPYFRENALTGTLVNFGIYLVFYLVMGLLVGLVYAKTSPSK